MKQLIGFFHILALAFSAYAASPISFTPIDVETSNLYIGSTVFSTETLPVGYDADQRYSGNGEVTITFFNADFSVRKTTTVKPTINGKTGEFWVDWLESDANLGSTFYASQFLFNDDELFEFVAYGYIEDDTNNRTWAYLVYNENGEFLGNIPDNKVYKFGDYAYFKEYTDNGTRFVGFSTNGTGGINAPKYDKQQLSFYRNPISGNEDATVFFSQTLDNNCVITIIGGNGQILYKKRLPIDCDSYTIPGEHLQSGLNIFSIQRGTTEIESGKLIVR